MISRAFTGLSLALLLTSCATSTDQEDIRIVGTRCLDPRPQICTADYQPVCAVLAGGQREVFSNGCNACTNPEVTIWTAGACPNQN